MFLSLSKLPIKILVTFIDVYLKVVKKVRWSYGIWLEANFKDLIVSTYMEPIVTSVKHTSSRNNAVELKFLNPNSTSLNRSLTFSSKEPETLIWLEQYGGGTLFDIGANIGIYSCYHSLESGGDSFAFEPSVLNLELLAKNISLNAIEQKVRIIPNPLDEYCSFATFQLSSMEYAGSSSTFRTGVTWDGSEIKPVLNYTTLGLSINQMFEFGLLMQKPTLMKIDVDGTEDSILKGATCVLEDPTLRSVLIEVNEKLQIQCSNISQLMQNFGFQLSHCSVERQNTTSPDDCGNIVYNRIYSRPN
jgi:FkbM family methyltransferase